jgi:hypothetical protein
MHVLGTMTDAGSIPETGVNGSTTHGSEDVWWSFEMVKHARAA